MEIETDTSRTVTEALLIAIVLHHVGSRSTRRHTPCTSSLQYLYLLQGSTLWRLLFSQSCAKRTQLKAAQFIFLYSGFIVKTLEERKK